MNFHILKRLLELEISELFSNEIMEFVEKYLGPGSGSDLNPVSVKTGSGPRLSKSAEILL
jgi:hypothetical protein